MTPADRVQAAAAAGQVILLAGIWLGGGAGPVALVAGVVYAIALLGPPRRRPAPGGARVRSGPPTSSRWAGPGSSGA